MPLLVTKANGTEQLYERSKIVKTCLRMGASRRVAEKVAEKVECRVYDGIETRKILKMVLKELGKHKPSVKYRICLRKAMSLMKPKPDFERFIQFVLIENGFVITPNVIVKGRCVEHEIDAVAEKNSEVYIVEVKHHYNYHTPTGLDESRIARAIFEDINEGFKSKTNNVKPDKSMIIVNTKFSDHAKKYAKCRNIQLIGWNSPSNQGLQTMIEKKKLYPLSCLKGLNVTNRERLASAGIVLLKQLAKANPERLRKETRISKEDLKLLIKKASTIISDKSEN